VDGVSSDEGVLTPTMTLTATLAPGPIPSPEPTVLLSEIQKAVDDVAQAVGRFGPKMAAKLSYPDIMAALFENHKQLQSSSLKYSDSFTCQYTKVFSKLVSLKDEAPLLWWLWKPLLEFFRSSQSHGFTLCIRSKYRCDPAI
jgi:hypothetical protein